MVIRPICHQKHAANGTARRAAAVFVGIASVETLFPHPGIEHPCGLRGDGRLKISAAGEVITQQKCTR